LKKNEFKECQIFAYHNKNKDLEENLKSSQGKTVHCTKGENGRNDGKLIRNNGI
jgi:hypothetical protein